jgi:cytochrome b561
MQTNRYGFFRRLVHWVLALIVLGLLAAGSLFFFLGFDGLKAQFGEETTAMLYQYHKSLGIVAFVLVVLQLLMRRRGVPPYDPPLSFVLRLPSRLVHWLMILGVLAMPILGYLATAAGGFPVQFFDMTLPSLISENKDLSALLFKYHAWVGWALLGLVGIHLAATFLHVSIARDTVFARIKLF